MVLMIGKILFLYDENNRDGCDKVVDKLADLLVYSDVSVVSVEEVEGLSDKFDVVIAFCESLEGVKHIFDGARFMVVNPKEFCDFGGVGKVVFSGDVDRGLVFEFVKAGHSVKIVKNKKVVDEVLSLVFVAPDDFFRVDIRIGLVKEVHEVEGSDKLFKCVVDFGDMGERVIYSGVRGIVEKEDLAGKKLVYVTNLIPRKMPGGYSHGMLLACGDGDGFAFIVAEGDIGEGCRVG